MNLEILEYAIFAIIVVTQIVFFLKTKFKIKEFNNSIAIISKIQITDLELTEHQINSFSSQSDIFDINKQTIENSASSENVNHIDSDDEGAAFEDRSYQPEIDFDFNKLVKVKLVESIDNNSVVFNSILNSLNKYLLRNRHSVADFSLIKDIVERNTDAVEEEVNLTLSTPLYLGLMGTMLGVVIGIFSMSDFIGAQIKDDTISAAIGILLGSVKIAMIASFVGLLLTIYNSAIVFKGSKSKLENKKNDFYTMIQVELLPSLNQGVGATFDSLQRNLFQFNEKFDSNLDRLSTVFDKNYESIIMQKQLVEQMDSSKVADITKYNMKVLSEMNNSLVQFDKFNTLFSNINAYLANSYKLADRSSELLERTSNFEKIATSIESSLDQNSKLNNFLSAHFSDLEIHKTKIDESIVNMGFNIKDTFDQLNSSMQHASQVLSEEAITRNLNSKTLFADFTNDLKESFVQQAKTMNNMFEEKKSSLDYLKHLETLLREVKALNSGSTDNERLVSQVQELNFGIMTTNSTLKRIENDAKKPFFKKIFTQK